MQPPVGRWPTRPRHRRADTGVIAVALTVLCVLVFVVGLQLRLPLLGTWFR
jgi:hypothetical protein